MYAPYGRIPGVYIRRASPAPLDGAPHEIVDADDRSGSQLEVPEVVLIAVEDDADEEVEQVRFLLEELTASCGSATRTCGFRGSLLSVAVALPCVSVEARSPAGRLTRPVTDCRAITFHPQKTAADFNGGSNGLRTILFRTRSESFWPS
jgi:hypothetical protein